MFYVECCQFVDVQQFVLQVYDDIDWCVDCLCYCCDFVGVGDVGCVQYVGVGVVIGDELCDCVVEVVVVVQVVFVVGGQCEWKWQCMCCVDGCCDVFD